MEIVPANRKYIHAWAEMRYALWTWDSVADHAEEAEELYLIGNPDRYALIALNGDGVTVGFAEATVRRDYVEGCETSAVAFLEGIYVRPEARLGGVAKALANAVADWGKDKGCTEYASNALLDNEDSHRFHAAIGFEETERVVYFRRSLS
jgi:aminoglycoside 6'-N-acetyltransferase I